MALNDKPPPLLVRADASAAQGTGHVMRCLALAHEWGARGGSVRFLTCLPDATLRRRIQIAGALLTELDGCYPDRRDLATTLSIAQQTAEAANSAPWVVLDGYGFDSRYQQQLRRTGSRLLVIDDNGHGPRYDADMILNHGLHAQQLAYTSADDAWLLLGTRYALLRREFDRWRGFHRPIAERAKKILVTLGGGAVTQPLSRVIGALRSLEQQDLDVRVLVGPLQGQSEILHAAAGGAVNIHFDVAVGDMAELMAWADLAIAAGGTTAWELAFMQTPMLLVTVADNQIAVAESLDEFGAGEYLGPAEKTAPSEIAVALRNLLADPSRRRQMARRGGQLVDGRGAERVVTALHTRTEYIPGDGFWIRPATAEDKLLCWQWAGDPVVRHNSFNPAPIPWHVHEAWFENKLASCECRFWIMQIGALPVGQIRYDRVGDGVAELSYSIAPGFRGMQLGTALLKATAELAGRELGVSSVRGVAFTDNPASRRAMINAGFETVAWPTVNGRDCVVLQRRCVSPWSREFHVAVH